ncbi:MAG TPA: ATP-dependent 6-phosphofructokinase [Sedimentisphaerales bacterium]|nr:ATP-dependent 6-phosphofructokinase [Sedimentisphaerales bacterium]
MDAHCLKPDELPDLTIEKLGPPAVDHPLLRGECHFVDDQETVLVYTDSESLNLYKNAGRVAPAFERAGPRRQIFFDPEKLNCGIVTCGGLCPGLNDVIRTITLSLIWQYGVKNVFGFKYGYLGLSSNAPQEPLLLTPDSVDEIHLKGGDILSSSRGPQDPEDMVENLRKTDIALLFCIGGDGTLHGASRLCRVIKERGLKTAVVGVPKTIDNDIMGIERSFGFSTAVEAARAAIWAAHAEAKGAWNGVSLVKLMGRDSGFIAAYTTLANSDVNFCFIPEVPLVLEGENGFLNSLEKRLDKRHHAVIVVAEGAGRDLTEKTDARKTDASGNILPDDIGLIIKERIERHFKDINKPIALKYIDPSYMIRSLTADSNDAAFCLMLGQNAVHAGMSGRTNMVIGYWNQYFTHVPISLTVLKRKKVDPNGDLWQTVLATTGQARV